MNTKPVPKEKFLELENASLKLYIMRRNVQELELKFKDIGEKLLQSENLPVEEWAIDLDRALFVQKQT
jgi:hypothetical protein